MMSFLLYVCRVSVVLLVFYLFYRALLKKETFHRLNRIVLVSTAVLSFVLPLCIVTVHLPSESSVAVGQVETFAGALADGIPALADVAVPWWHFALVAVYLTGVFYVLARLVVSVWMILKIVGKGKIILEEDGCKIIVPDNNKGPFSWMKYIVMSEEDFKENLAAILAHEKAHIRYGHSMELLLVDVISAFQWFNPAIWMLRSDLQDLHEFEADDAVLRSGANIREYQYLLIKKAVGKSGYSVANSLNHSILKKRITMMSKSRSPLVRGLRLVYVLPLVCLCIGLQARTVYEPSDKSNENSAELEVPQGSPVYILRYVWGEEKQISKEEFDKITPQRISAITVLKNDKAKEKYGDKAANGAIVITLKVQQEMDPITVVSYSDEVVNKESFYMVEPDVMPSFQGKGMEGFSQWLFSQIYRPKGCKHTGTMKVSFVVDKDGSVKNVTVLDSVCESLDNMVVSIIEKSPKWEPATSGGKPVEQCLRIPIVFQMR